MGVSLVDLILDFKKRCVLEEHAMAQEARLSSSEMSCVLSLNPGESIGCSELSGRMGLSPSRGSRIIEGLIEIGYLRRETDPDDRRYTKISLTSKGRDGRRVVDRAREHCESKLRSRLGPSEYSTVEQGLALLLGALEG